MANINNDLGLTLDYSSVMSLVNIAQQELSPKGFDAMMWAVFRRTGSAIRRAAIKSEQEKYAGGAGWISRAHDPAKVSRQGAGYGDGAGLSAFTMSIKVESVRGKIGQKSIGFAVGKVAPGYPDRGSGIRHRRRRGRIYAIIKPGEESPLPLSVSNVSQRVFKSGKGKYLATVPKGGIYYPHIAHNAPGGRPYLAVFGRGHESYQSPVGISVAEMPTNDAAPLIIARGQEIMEKRMVHEFNARMARISSAIMR